MPTYLSFLFAVSAMASLATALLVAGRLSSHLELKPGSRRIGHLDGLRGFLAFSVLLHHAAINVASAYQSQQWVTPDNVFFNQLGAGAVALFFMVSGTVFYPLVLKGVSTNWIGFIVKRLFRILPMVILSVAMVLLVLVAVTGRSPGASDVQPLLIWVSSWHQPPLLGLVEAKYINAQVLWSLAWEWQYYFLILPCCALLRDVLRRTGLATFLIPCSLLLLAAVGRWSDDASQTLTGATWWNTLPLFATGMLAHECLSRPRMQRFLASQLIGAVGVLCLVAAMITSRDAYGWSMPLFAVFFITVACGSSLGGLLQSRAALALGELSFAIYLLHGVVLWVGVAALASIAGAGTLPILLALPLLSALTVALSLLATRGVERPAMAAGEWLSARILTHRERRMVNRLVRLSR